MIIDFTITNFRSIKEEQTFSLHAETPGSHLQENISYPAGDKIGVLKSVGLYVLMLLESPMCYSHLKH